MIRFSVEAREMDKLRAAAVFDAHLGKACMAELRVTAWKGPPHARFGKTSDTGAVMERNGKWFVVTNRWQSDIYASAAEMVSAASERYGWRFVKAAAELIEGVYGD